MPSDTQFALESLTSVLTVPGVFPVRDLRTPQQGVHNWCPSDAKPRAMFTSEICGVRALGLLHVLLATAYKINNQLSSSAVVERCHR